MILEIVDLHSRDALERIGLFGDEQKIHPARWVGKRMAVFDRPPGTDERILDGDVVVIESDESSQVAQWRFRFRPDVSQVSFCLPPRALVGMKFISIS